MKALRLFILALSILSTASAQPTTAPGGVKGATVRYVTDSRNQQAGFKSCIAGDTSFIPFVGAGTGQLNSYPALLFAANNKLTLSLGNRHCNKVTLFAVYKCFDTSERHIWHIAANNAAELVLTNKRMADLKDYKYYTFIDLFPLNPKVNVYVHNKQSAAVEQTIQLGVKPASPNLPIKNFSGLIAEVIAFDRLLTTEERLKVCTYLSLKYGITLSDEHGTYLNSSGEKVWDGESYASFHNNIAGIARDDSSSLNQKHAVSSNNAELLQISAQAALNNNTYVVCGDNALPLTPAERIAGLPTMLQRKWLVTSNHKTSSLKTDLTIDTKQFDAELPWQPVYWLVIDRTASGDFHSSTLEFKKMDFIDADGKAHFNNLEWDTDSSGRDVFGVIPAQELLFYTAIHAPSCTARNDGDMQVRVLGGQPPYRLSLQSDNGVQEHVVIADNTSAHPFETITAGKYALKVTDAAGRTYDDVFYVNYSDAPQIVSVSSKYLLKRGGKAVINASQYMPYGISYHWSGPGQFYSNEPNVELTTPGVYTVQCTNSSGCSSLKDVHVALVSDNIFDGKVTVYPNPSQGVFTIKIALDAPADISLEIRDEVGRQVLAKALKGFANYRINEKLSTPGAYFLTLRSGTSVLSKTLIIAR